MFFMDMDIFEKIITDLNNMTIYERFENDLKNYKKILFFLTGEMGWETCLFSGAIRRYKKEHPNKIIAVATRKSREDFYTNCIEDIHTFEIEGDYNIVTPRVNGVYYTDINDINHYKSNNKENIIKNILIEINNKYPDYKIFDTSIFPHRNKPNLDMKKNDYNFIPRYKNKEIIEEILSNVDYKNKIIMTMFPRHRIDIGYRNWKPNSEEKWNDLYKRINDSNRYITFMSGVTPCYFKPDKNFKNIIDLENYVTENSSVIGLTIEALRKSNFSFGIITFGSLLSNCMNIPNIYFGDSVDSNIVKSHNFNNTISLHINGSLKDQQGCKMSVNKVFENLLDFSNKFC